MTTRCFITLDRYPNPEITEQDDIRSFLNGSVVNEFGQQYAEPEVRQGCSKG